MIYLSGANMKEISCRPDAGFMLTPMNDSVGRAMKGTLWAADTGCFLHPDQYTDESYLAWLKSRSEYRSRCLFATAPDVVGDAVATMEKSLPMLSRIRDTGYKAALVAQDGLEDMDIPWDEFDCLFIGGTTEWKLSEIAYQLAYEADQHGKWVHMGRVNSWRRLKAAAVSGYDSADGTYLVFGPDINLPKLNGWLDALNKQSMMNLG